MNNPLLKRIPQLDLLRAVAILMVIGNHMAVCPPEANLYLNQITALWYKGGWAGVDLFFVLSGFLVSGLLFNEYKKRGAVNIGKFIFRRSFKIYPAFWFLIVVTLGINLIGREPVYRGGYLSELLFIQNYHSTVWGHTWSLAVEEHFYIFLSLLFFVFLRFGGKQGEKVFDFIPKIFILLAIVCLAWRYMTDYYAGFSYVINIEQTHLRMDSLFFGVFLSYLWNFRGLAESEFLRKYTFFIFLAGVGCFVPAFVLELNTNFWLETFGLTILYLGGGLLLLALLKMDFGENRLLRSVAEIGKYSYSIYLWNLPMHVWLTKYTNLAAENWFVYFALYLAGTFILGIGTAKLIEYPFLKLRDRIIPSNVAALKTAGVV